MLSNFGKSLIVMGLFLVAIGILFTFGSKIPHIGRLPGDIYIKKKNFTFYFPLTTCILISILISLILLIFRK